MIRTCPTLDELAALLRLLDCPSPAAAAMHLATPVHIAVGADCVRRARTWQCGDIAVPATGDALTDAAAMALALDGPGVPFLPLSDVLRRLQAGDPLAAAELLKPLRSGGRMIGFGSEAVLGLASLAGDPDLGPEILHETARFLLQGPSAELPAVIRSQDVTALVEGDRSAVIVRSPNAPGWGTLPVDEVSGAQIDAAVRLFARQLGAVSCEVIELTSRFPGTFDAEALCELPDRWQAIAQLTVTSGEPGATLIGIDKRSLVAADPRDRVPAGFELLGSSSLEPAFGARHRASGLSVLLRRLP